MAKRKTNKRKTVSNPPEENATADEAKEKTAGRGAPDETDESSGPADAEEPAKAGATVRETASGFFKSLGAGLKTAGSTAERFARIGVNMADLERLKLKLNSAHARLGESVVKCWDAAPDIGVSATESSIRDHLLAVHDLRRRIRETDRKIKALQDQEQK